MKFPSLPPNLDELSREQLIEGMKAMQKTGEAQASLLTHQDELIAALFRRIARIESRS